MGGQSPLEPHDRLGESFIADRLQQIIDGRALECGERIFVISGDKHDLHIAIGRARDVESGQAGHPDVEERDIRCFGNQQRLRVGAVACHAGDHELRPEDRETSFEMALVRPAGISMRWRERKRNRHARARGFVIGDDERGCRSI